MVLPNLLTSYKSGSLPAVSRSLIPRLEESLPIMTSVHDVKWRHHASNLKVRETILDSRLALNANRPLPIYHAQNSKNVESDTS